MNSEQGATATATKRDHRQEVTDSIIKMLEAGVAPWQKPWEGAAMPFNPTSGRPYRGGNAVHLMATGLSRGYDDPRWMTYKQAAENGWQVKHGERGTHIEFWEVKERNTGKSQDKEQENVEADSVTRSRLVHRVYTIFNAKQIEGIPAHAPTPRTPFEAAANGEKILANSGAKINHDQQDRAFYNRATDQIHLPAKEAFVDAAGYYGTALHELAHWTGHPTRLNRPTLNESYRFGDLNYAKEELRAEIASVFMAAETGIPHDPANHASYVGSWIKALREDKNEIFRAAQDASRAADYVLGLDREVSRAEALEAGPAENQVGAIQDEIAALESDRGKAAVPVKGANGQLKASFAAARDLAAASLGDSARTFVAQTETGIYNGKIIGETDQHLVQRLSPQSAVAHMKHLIKPLPSIGESVTIAYSNEHALVQEMRDRTKGHELAR